MRQDWRTRDSNQRGSWRERVVFLDAGNWSQVPRLFTHLKHKKDSKYTIINIYDAFHAVSTGLWPALFIFFFFFSFNSSMLWMTTKKWLTTIFRFLFNFLWQRWSKSSGNLGRYRFVKTYTINSLRKKKMFQINFIMSRALFWEAQPKQKKIKMIFLPISF